MNGLETSKAVATQVRQYDYERYLCSLFAPASTRARVWAVQALCYELLRIPPAVSDAMVGMVRLKWWQESLEALAATSEPQALPPEHPVLAALAPWLATAPWLVPMAGQLQEQLLEQLHEPQQSEAVPRSLAVVYAMLGRAAVPEPEPEPKADAEATDAAYATLGRWHGYVALIRTHVAGRADGFGGAHGWYEAMKQEQATLRLPARCSRYGKALHQLERLWTERITRAMRLEAPVMLRRMPALAPRLAWRMLAAR